VSISPVKAEEVTYFAEMPPYDDKWTLVGGSNYPYADANLSTGRLAVFMFPFTGESSSAQVKTWKRVWLPETDLEITYSWRLKGYLMCGLYLSFTGVDLYIFVEKSLNSGTINETTLFYKYVDLVWEYQDSINIPWTFPDPIVVSIPEAGYYNIGAGLSGRAGGFLASCVFGGEEDYGAWVSMKLRYTCAVYWDRSGYGTINVELPDRTMHLHDCLPITTFHDAGTPVKITATPDNHFQFDYWELDGVNQHANELEFILHENHIVKAYFSWVNNPPNTPSTPSGLTSGYVYTTYSYSTSTIDPDGDNVRYELSWGDGTSTTTGFYASDTAASASHSWTRPGTYQVKVQAQDVYEAWSSWSNALTVSISQNDASTGGDAGNNFTAATSISPGSYLGTLYQSNPTDTRDWYQSTLKVGRSSIYI